MIRISKILVANFFLVIFPIFSLAFAQSVTVTGTALSHTFSPGTSTPIVSLSFSNIINAVLPARITNIQVDRTGDATDTDVPSARLYEDANQNNIVDVGETQFDPQWFSSGSLTFIIPNPFYLPDTTKNLLIVYDVASGANTSHTAGATMLPTYISDHSPSVTVIAFAGVITGNQPLPVELTSFTALVQSKTVNLKWQTATEVNNYGFEIQRQNTEIRNQKSEWEKIGFVQGYGNSNSPKEYSFEDKNPQAGKLQYRLKQIDFDGKFEYSNAVEVNFDVLVNFVLDQNYPNPFNPTTTIKYEIPKNSFVKLSIYDLLGREISTLVNQAQNAGYHEITFNGKDLSSGIYIYQIQAGEFSRIKKMLLMK
ncbi:MAG: T9SS type A sorting domain-containing protein [Ignavibacteriales bacterium]|nr:T9SS type A sorting domain-containing protein [Ignavibacteriales bacterium]